MSCSKLPALALCALFAAGASAVPSPSSVGDVQILLHNDLYGEESSRTDAVIVLGTPQTQSTAAGACASLGESLWTLPANLNANNFLAYLAYQAGSSSSAPPHWGPWKEKRGGPPQFQPPHGGPGGPPHGGPPSGPGGPHGPPVGAQQLYYVAGQGAHGECRAITPSGQILSVACSASLPALCTQTAPATTMNATDTSAQYQTQVSAGNAVYTGYRDALSFRFLGIQYGAYPARFTYSSVYNATGDVSALEFGAICRQNDAITNVNDGSEDCLHLNIYTPSLPSPKDAAPKLKPVMLWIHGGGFGNGYGSDPTFDGGNIASRGDVVLVTINYRLGDFGFLVLNETGVNGNYGISDQVTALQWVHDNIHNFGGNASQVTIFGQSAGAGSVRALLQSPPAEGLFSAAILQSDLGIPSYSHYLSLEQEIASQTIPILNATGCLSGNGAAELACLRAYNASALVALPTVANNIVVDGKYVVTPAINFNSTGHVNAVPLLIGTMRDDGAPFLSYVNTNNLTAALVKNGLSVPQIAGSGVFPVPNGANVSLDIFNVTAEAETDSWFRCLDYATAYAAAKTHTLPEVYYYEFNRSYQITYWPPAPLKALCNPAPSAAHPNGDPSNEYFKAHSGELMYVFASWRNMWGLPERDENDTPFTQFTVDTWTSWARSHNPTPDAGYLAARGYTNTTREIQVSGQQWMPVTADSQTMRWLQWPSREEKFHEAAQCAALGQPLDYFFLPGV